MLRARLSKRENNGQYNNCIDREVFTCVELEIPTNSGWVERITAYAERIVSNLNKGQANTSENRDVATVETDNLLGVIAERACFDILVWKYGSERIKKPQSDSSFNQIDIELDNGKTIEVRSSCVRNGIDFALFSRDKNKQQYFDIIGPYTNGYKPGEALKDYYMRVLYCCDKHDFMDMLRQAYMQLFITGGATKSMMSDPAIYQKKHLIPAGGQVREESDYRVIPLGKSLDANEFFDVLEKENRFVSIHDF